MPLGQRQAENAPAVTVKRPTPSESKPTPFPPKQPTPPASTSKEPPKPVRMFLVTLVLDLLEIHSQGSED